MLTFRDGRATQADESPKNELHITRQLRDDATKVKSPINSTAEMKVWLT